MDCDRFSEKIDLYIHNELSESERADMDAHMQECEACRKELDFARKINAALKNLPPIDVPLDFKDKLHEKIKAEKKNRFYKMWQPYAALAACVVLAVVLRSGAGDMLDSLKASEVTPMPPVRSEVKDDAEPIQTEQPSDASQQTQEPVSIPVERPNEVYSDKSNPLKSQRQQTAQQNSENTTSVPAAASQPAQSEYEMTDRTIEAENTENMAENAVDSGVQTTALEDTSEKKVSAYSARSSFPEVQQDMTEEMVGAAMSGGGSNAASAPMALKSIAGLADGESACEEYLMNVDGEGRSVAESFMSVNQITKSGEAYSITRDELKSLIDELESSGAVYELLFDIDACGDTLNVIIGDI